VTATLVTLAVGDSAAVTAYRDSIERNVGRAGVVHRSVVLPPSATPEGFLDQLERLNNGADVHGVLLLLPLPAHLPLELALEHLSPLKDVDGITPLNAGRLHLGLPALRPSTPQGGMELLDHYGIAVDGRRAVVVGRSNVVGKPLAALLTARNATVTLSHRRSEGLPELTRNADVIALAAGQPGLLHGDDVSPGAVVLDFGINVLDGVVVGDADAESVVQVAGAYTPVPGGTGPVTTMVLARNTVAAAFASLGIEVESTETSSWGWEHAP
jgi:methylenetetrahydrofolate dehydrogenase (NADP+)/methenyltetrahydrofolate cyclohydrolase